MKIGIVSNSKICLPLLSYLSNYRQNVIFYWEDSQSPDLSKTEITGFCRANGIPVHIEERKDDLYQWQQMQEPDVIFFSGYSQKVDVKELSGVPKGIFNIHFGKLPQYRGPSPVFWQLKKGEREPGMAIHEMAEKTDSGAVVWEQNIKNEEYHNYNYINQVFSELQVKGVFEIVNALANKVPLKNKVQDETKAHYYKRPQLGDVMINWDKMEATEILDLVKACNSWNNGAATIINGYEFKILDAQIAVKQVSAAPGTINLSNNSFNVACINNASLNINFFNINSTCIPARHAGFYGIQTGHKFINNL